MKQVFYVLLLLTFMVSCSQSEGSTDPEIPEPVQQGGQSFSILNKEITAKTPSIVDKDYVPAYAFISIVSRDGIQIFDFEKIDVIAQGESYATEEVMLDPGTYNLTEFVLVDADDIVVSLVPTATSALSQFSGTSLPYRFTVESADSKTTTVENIEADGYSFVEFGYDEEELSFPDSEDFFTLTVDDSEVLTTKSIALKSLTGSTYTIDWGDGTVDQYVSGLSDYQEEYELTHNYEVKGIYEIKIFGAIEVIEYLNFGNNESGQNYKSNITSAEIDKLILLKTCQFYAGALTSLDTSNNRTLEKLSVGYNQITSLNLSNNVNLKSIWARYNQLTQIDVSTNINLEILWVTGNQISNLDVSNNENLKMLLARENNLTSLDLTNNSILETIDLSDNSLPNIDVSQNLNLNEINVGRNNLTGIDLSKNTELERVDLYINAIQAIDLTANLKLRDLYIEGNLLSELDLSQNEALERLIIRNNNFSQIDITHNPNIFDLEIGGNQFLAPELDQIISYVYDQVILNSISPGHISFENNPGTDLIDEATIAKINELELEYNWTFFYN